MTIARHFSNRLTHHPKETNFAEDTRDSPKETQQYTNLAETAYTQPDDIDSSIIFFVIISIQSIPCMPDLNAAIKFKLWLHSPEQEGQASGTYMWSHSA